MKDGAVCNDAFLVCHEIYQAARELVNSRVPTTQLQSASKFLWRPDLRPRLVGDVADFARAGGKGLRGEKRCPTPKKRGDHPGFCAKKNKEYRTDLFCLSHLL